MSSQCAKRLCKTKSGTKSIPIKDTDRCPFELAEPEWMNDNASTLCLKCNTKFGLVTRRHHCRRCGLLLCSSCTNACLPLQRMCFLDPVRVCDPCAKITIEENKFYTEDLKILTTGALFSLSFSDGTPNCMARCHLSANHRALILDGCKRETLPLHRLTNEFGFPETAVGMKPEIPTTMSIIVRGENLKVEFITPATSVGDEVNRAGVFLIALDIALSLKEESKSVIGA